MTRQDPGHQMPTPPPAAETLLQSKDGAAGVDVAEDGTLRSRPARPPRKTLSQVLVEIAEDTSRDSVAVRDLISLPGGRGMAGLLFIFAFPNILPSPPGLSGLLGLPLLYLSSQMMLARVPWLPGVINEREVSRARFAQIVTRIDPWMKRAERLLRPRWSLLVSPRAEQMLGAYCLLMAVVLSLPIPFGNALPSLAICLIALGLLERDGRSVALGLVTGLVALAVAWGVVYTLVKSALFILLNAFD